MYTHPAESDELVLVLEVKDVLLALCRARVRRAALPGNEDVCDAKPVLGEFSCQNGAGLHVAVCVGLEKERENLNPSP